MLGRLYSVIFIFFIIYSLWFQRKFLERSSNEINSQLDFENMILPTSSAMSFKTNSYQNGILKYSFSGNKITYYNDNHFEAEGDLLYIEYDGKGENVIIIKTEKAYGQIENNSTNSNVTTFPISGNSRIKNATLPNEVIFNLKGNLGKTHNVIIDMDKETIHTKENFLSNGPQGNITGKGFHYSIQNEELKVDSYVDGNLMINKSRNNIKK